MFSFRASTLHRRLNKLRWVKREKREHSGISSNHLSESSHLEKARSIKVDSFDYDLPPSVIAQRPLSNRSSSKLLAINSSLSKSHHHFSDLPDLLPSKTLLVLNSSRVVPGRLLMVKETGGKAEVLLLEPVGEGGGFNQPADGQVWRAIIGGKGIRQSNYLSSQNDLLKAFIMSREATHATIRLSCQSDLPLVDILLQHGKTPLPPYIKRTAGELDTQSYQTVYASKSGSIAAPTAGLHMTHGVLHDLKARGLDVAELILHVGAGTFQPVSSEFLGGHRMHEESIMVNCNTIVKVINQLQENLPICAVGTTSVRTLESIYWFGVRLLLDQSEPETFYVNQWEPYERLDANCNLPSAEDALSAVLNWAGGPLAHLHGRTSLMIVPGYIYKIVDILVTNFHTPRSTLLLLVSAFIGGDPHNVLSIYHHAIKSNYRFLSYGDSSIYFSKFLSKDQ